MTLAPLAHAEQTCPSIADDRARLLCYDRQAGRQAAEALPRDITRDAPTAPSAAGTPPAPGTGAAVLDARGAAATPAGPPLSNTVFGSPASPATEKAAEARDERRSLGTDLTDLWELEPSSDRGRFLLRPYKPMYVMLGDWSNRPNQTPASPNPDNVQTVPLGYQSTDMKFQISLKSKIAEDLIAGHGDLWVGYTQTSYWQLYNGERSRPFRETNYEPEAMLVFGTNYSVFGWKGRMAGVSFNHQSNGRSDPLSRSWNRVIAQFGFERDNWMVMLRPWWRVPEKSGNDDNPDITDYLGHGDLLVVRKSAGHQLSVLARHTLRGGDRSRGSLQLDYAFPVASYLKGYVQLFTGYGASLIDYNHRQTRIGVGVSLVQWL